MTKTALEEQIIESEQLYDLFVSKISRESANLVELQSNRIRNRIAIFVTIGLALLAATVALALEELKTSLKLDARSEARLVVEREIDGILDSKQFNEQVKAAVSADYAVLSEQGKYLQEQILFLNAVNEFEDDTSFSDAQADALISGVISAKENGSEIFEISEVLDSIVPGFAAANRFDFIERLNDALPEEMAESTSVCQAVTLSLGFDIASFEVDPDKATGRFREAWDKQTSMYRQFSDNCRRLKYPEVGFIFDAVLGDMIGEDEEIMGAIMQETSKFTPAELGTVARLTESLLTGDWVNPDQNQLLVERARQRLIQLVQKHGDKDPTSTLNDMVAEFKNP